MHTAEEKYAKQCVERGWNLLTEHFGHNRWFEKIDLANLDMSIVSSCIVGQLFGTYWAAMTELGIEASDAGHFGYTLSEDVTKPWFNWEQLAQAWRNRIHEEEAKLVNVSPSTPTEDKAYVYIIVVHNTVVLATKDAKEATSWIEAYDAASVNYTYAKKEV